MKYLREILVNAATQRPKNIALSEVGGRQIAFGDLHKNAIAVQSSLRSLQVKKGHRVGIISAKSIESVTAIFGVLYSQAAYVPIDAEAPSSRAMSIISNCTPTIIFIEKSLWSKFESQITQDYTLIDVSPIPDMLMVKIKKPTRIEQPNADISDLAIILYTSGSTGTPKGVMITDLNALSFIDWANATFELSEKDVFTSIAPFHFDLSVFDLYVAVFNTAELVLINGPTTRNPRMISTLIDQRNITVWYSTPSLLKLMLNYGKLDRFSHTSIRYVLFAGEVFHIDALRKMTLAWPHAQFYNLYGPTETNVVTYYKIPKDISTRNKPYPIGKACSYAKIKIHHTINDSFDTEEGELWVSGTSVTPGYWKKQGITLTPFETDDNNVRWYKTGDWVKIDDQTNYEFIGRKDRMIKKNGYRIELAEIETAIQKYDGVVNAAVVVKIVCDKIFIQAFYQMEEHSVKVLNLLELQEHCLKYIPKYMLPDAFAPLQNIPTTSSHKIDYQKLSTL